MLPPAPRVKPAPCANALGRVQGPSTRLGARLGAGTGFGAGVMLIAAVFALGACAEEEALLLHPILGLRRIPVDTTVPGELPEGTYVAFGLVLPRGLRIVSKTPQAIQCTGAMAFEDLSNYVRDRVDGGKVETGPWQTTFRRVTVIDAPSREVDIDVLKIFQGTRIVVTDKTRKKAKREPEITEKERWGRMGLTTDGKVLEKYAQ